MMDRSDLLAGAYARAMRVCGWTHAQDDAFEGAKGRVLDVGCGPAALAHHASAYVGVDKSMGMLRRAGDAHVVCADAARLPFPDRVFDTVVSTAFLGLLDPAGRQPVLREMARVCSGVLVVLEPMTPLSPWRRAVALSRHPVEVAELRSAGWQVTSVGPRVYARIYTLVRATPTQSR